MPFLPYQSLQAPLFDALDPYGTNRPQPAQRQPALPPLSPDDEESLLSRIGGTALGGLGYVGGSLSKAFGGRAIRGLLGGKPEELASILPFSDTLGITNPDNEVRGSELLGAKDASFFSPEGLGGFGLEVLLDPATYLSFGGSALTPLGEAASKVGVLPKAIGGPGGRLAGLAAGSPEAATLAKATGQSALEVAGQRLGGHLGVGVPFAGNAATFDLSSAGNALASLPGVGPALGLLDQATGPLRRGASALFEKGVMGQTDPVLQGIARDVSAKEPAALARARGAVNPLIEEAAGAAGFQGGRVDAGVEAALQGQGQGYRQMLEGQLPVAPELQSVLQGQQGLQADMLERLRTAGYPDQALQDTIGYAPRQAAQTPRGGGGPFGKGALPTEQLGREDILKGIPTAGPRSINELTSRADLKDMTDLSRQAVIRSEYLGMGPAEEQAMFALKQQAAAGPLPPADAKVLADLEAKWVQGRHLADYYQSLDTDALAQAGGLFPNHPLLDLTDKLVKDEQRLLKAEALHRGIAGLAEPAAALGPDAVPLAKVLEDAGLTFNDAAGNRGAMAMTLQALVKEGKLPPGATLADLAGLAVPGSAAESLARFTRAATSPAGLQPFVKLWDSITNLTKPFQTVFWPANHARNQTTAFFQNWVHGAFDPTVGNALNPAAYVKPWLDAKEWYAGRLIPDANKIPDLAGLSAEEASKKLALEIASWDVPHRIGQIGQEVIGADPGRLTRVKSLEIPTAARPSLGDIAGMAVPKSLSEANPLNVAGVMGSQADTFAPVKAGRQMQTYLDDINRTSVYIAKRKQGFLPEQAFQESMLAHYDFSNLSQFERSTMRRLIPFYSWARQNVPAALGEVLGQPGGKVATAIKATGEARGPDPGFVPEYLGPGVALPLGERGPDGLQRYLSSTGLPIEDVAAMTTGSGLLGQLNPLIKGPAELATGKQFFTGRDLADLYPTTGSVLGDQVLMNSPLSRFATTARTLGDERKGLGAKAVNLLTGLRLTDVDTEKYKDIAVRDFIDQSLAGNPGVRHFSRLYVPPDQVPSLSPFEQQLLGLYQARERSQRRRASP